MKVRRSEFQSNRDYDLFSGRLTRPCIIKALVWRSAGTAAGTNDNACCEQSNDWEKIAAYFRSNSTVHALFPGAATSQINQICSGMRGGRGNGFEGGGNRLGRWWAKSPRRSFRAKLSAPRSLEPGNAIMSHVINSPLQLHSPSPPLCSSPVIIPATVAP